MKVNSSVRRRPHQLNIIVQLKTSLRIILARHEIHDQRILDRKHRVIGQVFILGIEDLRREGLVAVICSLHHTSLVYSRSFSTVNTQKKGIGRHTII